MCSWPMAAEKIQNPKPSPKNQKVQLQLRKMRKKIGRSRHKNASIIPRKYHHPCPCCPRLKCLFTSLVPEEPRYHGAYLVPMKPPIAASSAVVATVGLALVGLAFTTENARAFMLSGGRHPVCAASSPVRGGTLLRLAAQFSPLNPSSLTPRTLVQFQRK